VERLKKIIDAKAKQPYGEDENLIQAKVLDSLDFIWLISEIEREFGVEIDFLAYEPDKIMTCKGLWEVINELA
jgi:acyl carrier protein